MIAACEIGGARSTFAPNRPTATATEAAISVSLDFVMIPSSMSRLASPSGSVQSFCETITIPMCVEARP